MYTVVKSSIFVLHACKYIEKSSHKMALKTCFTNLLVEIKKINNLHERMKGDSSKITRSKTFD